MKNLTDCLPIAVSVVENAIFTAHLIKLIYFHDFTFENDSGTSSNLYEKRFFTHFDKSVCVNPLSASKRTLSFSRHSTIILLSKFAVHKH